MFKNAVFIFLTSFIFLTILPANGFSASPRQLVDKGNRAYRKGKFDEALSAYDEATVASPESPYIYFNKGAALYKKGDYRGATEAFEKAALKSKDIPLEAKSRFNLGNCAFREAERQQDSDLNKAVEACTKSIRHYQETLGLVPDFKEAAENIEVVRLVMKDILDKINKQKQAAEQQAKERKHAIEKLKDLIKKQKEALARNQDIEDKRNRNGDSPELSKRIKALAQDQKELKEETDKLSKKLSGAGGQKVPPDKSPAQKHLDNASKEQQGAFGNLTRNHTSEAKANQEKAIKELNDALSSLEKGGKSSGKSQGNKQQGGGEQAKQQQASSAEKPSQDKQDQNGKPSAMAQMSTDAHDILDEEKENKKQRRLRSSGGFTAVDKDW